MNSIERKFAPRARALHRYCQSVDRAVARGSTIAAAIRRAHLRAARGAVSGASEKTLYRHYRLWKAAGRPGWRSFLPGYRPARKATRSAAFKAFVYALAEHAPSLRAVYDTVVIRWRSRRSVPGIGKAAATGEPFPFSYRTFTRFFSKPEQRTLQTYFTARQAFLRLAGKK